MRLPENQYIDIAFETQEGMKWAKSSVIRSVSGDRVLVSPPMFRGDPVPIRPGTETIVMTTTSSGAYKIEAAVLERIMAPEKGLLLELYGQMERAQRREYVRVPCNLTAELAWMSAGGPRNRKATVLDISGGGIRVRIVGDSCPEMGTVVHVSFGLPASSVQVDCRTVWVAGSRVRGWYVGMDFGTISRGQRDTILAYIVAKQRELLSKDSRER